MGFHFKMDLGWNVYIVAEPSMEKYCQTSNIGYTSTGNKPADHSDVVRASPPTTSPFST